MGFRTRTEWKGLTNRPKPSVALTKDRPEWTFCSLRPNDAREAYTGNFASRKLESHPA